MPLFLSIQVPKGGPGKTATTHALSYAFAFRCLNVLVVDCDSQRDLTRAFFGETIENIRLYLFFCSFCAAHSAAPADTRSYGKNR